MNIFLVIVITVSACIPADLFWYYLGRSRGGKVLNIICTISLEPDYCVRRTELSFEKLGSFSLVLAKFVPGLQTIAPPMAGLTGMPTHRFLTLDTLGAVIWAVVVAVTGFLFADQLTEVATRFTELGGLALAIVIGLLAAFVVAKLIQRHLFLSSLRTRILKPEEVNEKLGSTDALYIIDLRHRLDFNALPYVIPNSVRIPMEHIDKHHDVIPRDRDIVLYCS
jgi:membrane protein DedA with SNARE-associated domain